jgi:hypothetical protein
VVHHTGEFTRRGIHAKWTEPNNIVIFEFKAAARFALLAVGNQ